MVPPFEPIVPKAELLERGLVPANTGAMAEAFERYPAMQGLTVERILYRSDGVEVEAVMVSKPGTKRGPTVLFAKGGGQKHRVSPPVIGRLLAPLAQAGMCVLATEYRSPPLGKDEFCLLYTSD
ncbi:MAG: hypothetical protein KUG77_08825, partial [Nannocystaceae bacterium]|nr:hypothetical protein [Nannocystaceae bacterium]